MSDYEAAWVAIPWKPWMPTPEEAIRRGRLDTPQEDIEWLERRVEALVVLAESQEAALESSRARVTVLEEALEWIGNDEQTFFYDDHCRRCDAKSSRAFQALAAAKLVMGT